MEKEYGGRPSGPPSIFSFIWLIYLVFPLYTFFDQPIDQIVEGLALLAVFVAMYLYSFRRLQGRFYCVLGLIIIIFIFCLKYDVSYLYFGFYPSPIIGMLRSKKQMVISMMAMVALFISVGWESKLYLDSHALIQLIPAVLIMLVLPIALRIGQRSKDLRERLNLANEEISRLSKNEERQRISRDLHDTLGHTLSLITLKSELAEKLVLRNPERAIQEVRDIQQTSRSALKQVRELVSGMNAVTIRDEIVHAKQILAAAGIVLDAKGDSNHVIPSPLIDNILGMCLRESVTNVVKHSRARTCSIELVEQPGILKLFVTDDGKGTDTVYNPAQSASSSPSTCNGLKGMRDRLKLVEGELVFDSAMNKGTRLLFTVPLVNKSVGEVEVR
ncbi:sensor histidine kinase [Paenibacillus baekrokdamisoli]|uniref:histidine kinase n=1 Tax=Paenibacillus baekrokdamisoli TaxID=1712516 RepID=A0A3G9JFH0_9BACL|nr:sensor histidine kinase [Paenibacillus baekrokdamisoli]MBB3068157.1 two-component system sensor histidine kinase DesK [Paenibacillus baekrokdamisoli]BBH22798.1 sensor histidine kinase [Paenibacillus baekrokdamisoli]